MTTCKRPPRGWKCSRPGDHPGPCAASYSGPIGLYYRIRYWFIWHFIAVRPGRHRRDW